MSYAEYRLLLFVAVMGATMLGYVIGKYLSRPDRVIEKIIFINKEFEGTMGPDKVTCGTCRGDVDDDTLRANYEE